jgi:hypothetical protein
MTSIDKNRVNAPARLAGAAIFAMAATTGPVFGQQVAVGSAATASSSVFGEQAVVVSNTGTAALKLGAPAFSPGFVKGTPWKPECGATLRAGETCNVTVRFRPTAIGLQTGTLTIPTSDRKHPTLTVALSGTGVAAGSLVAGTTTTRTVTVSNTSAAPLIISGFVISAPAGVNASQFAVTNVNCPMGGAGLAVGGTCTVNVTPPTTGTIGGTIATLDVNVAAPGTTQHFPVR